MFVLARSWKICKHHLEMIVDDLMEGPMGKGGE
jgi:hypothetical protein